MRRTLAGMVILLYGGVTALDALAVTQDFLDHECRKIEVKVVGNDAPVGARPAKVIIDYSCSEIGQAVEYEALHYLCPHRGPRAIAAAVYDVQGQTYLRDMDESGNYRSVIKVEDIPTPSCDLPL